MDVEPDSAAAVRGGDAFGCPEGANRPPRVALLGLELSLAAALWEALAAVGCEAVVVPLDRAAVAAVARAAADALVLDGHRYLNTRAILDDLRAVPAMRALPVVVLGPVVALGAVPPLPLPDQPAATVPAVGARGAPGGGALDLSVALRQVLDRIDWLAPCAGPQARQGRQARGGSGAAA